MLSNKKRKVFHSPEPNGKKHSQMILPGETSQTSNFTSEIVKTFINSQQPVAELLNHGGWNAMLSGFKVCRYNYFIRFCIKSENSLYISSIIHNPFGAAFILLLIAEVKRMLSAMTGGTGG